MWVTLHILWKAESPHIFAYLDQQAVSDICTYFERQSHHIVFFSYDQQAVSDIAHFMEGSLIFSNDQ